MPDLQPRRPGIVVPVHVDPTGESGPTRQQSRGRRWRRVAAGLYVPSSVDGSVLDQRIVEAVVGMPTGAAVTGWAALGWCAPRWFNGLAADGRTALDVPIALGDHTSVARRPGVVTSNDWLFDDDVHDVDGVPLTVAARSVTHEVRRTRFLLRAVQIIDMAAANDLVSLEELARYVVRIGPRGGTRLLRQAVALGDENAWSPLESTQRVLWELEGGFPRPRANLPLFDHGGRHLITPDLFDPVAGVAGEYDGTVHLDHGPRRRDLNRDALYRDLGIEAVTMMSPDLRDTTDFLRRLAAAYRRASRRTGQRPWTANAPPWWVDTSTVALRRALDDEQRAIWLRRRAS